MASRKNMQNTHIGTRLRALHAAVMDIVSVMNRPQRDEVIIRDSVEASVIVLITLILRHQLSLDLLHDLRIDGHVLIVIHVSCVVLHVFVSEQFIIYAANLLRDPIERIDEAVLFVAAFTLLCVRRSLLPWAPSSYYVGAQVQRLVGVFA